MMLAKMRTALLLMVLMMLAPMSGCIGGTPEEEVIDADATLTIDGLPATEATVRLGEWHDLLLIGEGLRLSAPAHDVFLFVNGSMDLDSSVPVEGDRLSFRLLTTPYTEVVELTIYDQNGRKTMFSLPIENGTLDAMMLDAPTSFEQFTQKHASPDEWNRLRENRYFQFASQKMGGIQEMMAVIEMVNLVDSGTVDCVIVDTPPAQNAQQFFEAPQKIQHLFSQSGLHWLTSKESGFATFSFAKGLISKGLQFFLGVETIVEISDFFTLFKSVAIALEETAERCDEVLHSKDTEYWLVEIPHYRLGQLDQLEEYLLEHGITIKGTILNRTLPKLKPLSVVEMDSLKYTDPLLESVMKDIENRYSELHCEKTSLQLPQALSVQLESIDGLWEWSLGLADVSEDSPSTNIPSDI